MSGKDKRRSGERGNPVSAMRIWEVAGVSMRCPHCGHVFTVMPAVLHGDQLWHYEEFDQECPDCGKCFYAEVDDDDR